MALSDLVSLSVCVKRRPPIEIDGSVPRFQATWAAFAVQFRAVAEDWIGQAVPINRYGGDDGFGTFKPCTNWLRGRLSECRRMLDDVCRVSGEDLRGWELRFWKPEEFQATNRLTLIAVDPKGIGHDISALADGRDDGCEESEAR